MDINEIKYYYDLISEYTLKLENNKLSISDLENIKKKIKYLESMIDVYFKIVFKLGSILDYNELYKKGFNESDILNFKRSDDEYLENCLKTLKDNKENHDYMFGYPANMVDFSYFTKYSRSYFRCTKCCGCFLELYLLELFVLPGVGNFGLIPHWCSGCHLLFAGHEGTALFAG